LNLDSSLKGITNKKNDIDPAFDKKGYGMLDPFKKY
jgi:hypothetical protein